MPSGPRTPGADVDRLRLGSDRQLKLLHRAPVISRVSFTVRRSDAAVADLAKADRLVLVVPMIPRPGETADEMWEATGWRMPQDESGAIGVFYHDVDPILAAEAMSRERRQSETTGRERWPLDAWPAVPTHVIIGRDDRFFPADWLRGVVRDRLGVEPDEIGTGHTPALSRPRELVELLESYRP